MSSGQQGRYLPFATNINGLRWPLFRGKQAWSMQRLADLPLTQPNSGTTDDQQTQQATTQLVQAWMDRLQVLSVVTTFFASMDGQLLGLTGTITVSSRNSTLPSLPKSSTANEVANAGLAGALIFHIAAAIISFTASFILLRYKIIDANTGALPPDGGSLPNASLSSTSYDANRPIGMRPSVSLPVLPPSTPGRQAPSSPKRPDYTRPISPAPPFPLGASIFIEQLHPFPFLSRHSNPPEPPLRLLTRCHTLCMYLSASGFILAVTGVLAYSWTELPKAVSIFSSACLVVCFGAGVFVLR